MTNPERLDKDITDQQSVSKRRSIEGLEELEKYRETIQTISAGIMKIDWNDDYNINNNKIKTLDGIFRDAIVNIAGLRNKTVGKKIPLDLILKHLTDALNELSRARDLAQGKNIQGNLSSDDKYARVTKCWELLNFAERLMVVTRKTVDKS